MKNPLTAGSRESDLALTQTQFVMDALKARHPQLEIRLKTFKTQGDIILDTSLSQVGDKGLFVKELEMALLAGEIDFAVHSMKDMPSEQPDGLRVFSFGKRETPFDAFVSKTGTPFMQMPTGAVIGTSSLRREALLKRARPDLHFQLIRGNVPTRLGKLQEGPYDGIVLAVAGLRRLHRENVITHIFPPEEMLPACSQGTLAVEIANPELMPLFEPLIDPETETCTRAERAFLKTLEGGCQIPMAAYAWHVDGDDYHIKGMICDTEGKQLLMTEKRFTPAEAEAAGHAIAQDLLGRGGREILAAILHSKV